SFAGPVDGDPVATDEVISVYPNPAKDQAAVYVVVKLHEGMEKGTVQVFDPIGRLVHTEQVASSTAIVEVPVQGFVPGLYLVALDGEGLRIGTGKFELTR
ncbi:MAG TPA: T9SS type A sorting domain-containing protein, partial [Flavobacteriales bacterium]|nr:T9SS type A sorting domain-containing protein [Flavobacteriales bacterium]